MKNITLASLLTLSNHYDAQNSLVGDGFGGRSWYLPSNFYSGPYSAYAICGTNKQLYCWGSDNFYQLGDNNYTGVTTPVMAIGMSNIKYFSAGYMMGAIKNDNTSWIWGYNGSTGAGWVASDLGTIPLQFIANAKFVDGGIKSIVFTKNDGTVWSGGINLHGHFGNGTTSAVNTTVAVQMTGVTTAVRAVCSGFTGAANDPSFTLVLLANGTVMQCGKADSVLASNQYNPAAVSGLSNIVDIKANSYAAYALTASGDVYSWGYNGFRALGTAAALNAQVTTPTKIIFPVGTSSIVALSTVNDGVTIYALDENHNVYAWGYNANGQCGNGTTINIQYPTLVATNVSDIMTGETFSYILKTDRTYLATGASSGGGSIWMNLSNTQRNSFTQIDPTIAPMNLCAMTFLPVELFSFMVNETENSNILTWTTATETNNSFFTIEKSEDAMKFHTIGKVLGNGITNHLVNYSFTDNTTNQSICYYRLKQTDVNGDFKYSTVKSTSNINLKDNNQFMVFPNPVVDDKLFLNYTILKSAEALITIRNPLNQICYSKTLNLSNEYHQTEFNIPLLEKGTYFITIENQNELLYHKKIIIK